MERMLKKVGYGRGGGKGERERRGRGRGRSADRAISEDVLFRKLLRVLPTPACAEWVTVMEFTKRRFCGRKCDNELYRSNSFKFERFEGKEDSTAGALDLAPARKQVALCDDYSLPVDFVNKRRPLSLGSVPHWSFHNFHGASIEILENYSDPRDSKAYLEPGEEASGKVYTSPDKDYSHPYTDSSTPERAEGEDDGVYEHVGAPRLDTPTPRHTPYYYGDLHPPAPVPAPASPDGPMPPDEMSRQRNFYETAFDSRISKSDDDLDVDVVINKSILPGGKFPLPVGPGPSAAVPDRRKVILARQELVKRKPRSVHIRRDQSVDSLRSRDQSVDSLTRDLDRVELHEPPLPLRGFAPPTPPSSAPLPTKFPSSHSMASVHSAPNLPGARLKDARLPIKSVRCRIEDARVLEGRPRSFTSDGTGGDKEDVRYSRPKSLFCPEQNIAEIKSRPETRAESSTAFLTTAQVLEIKGRPRRVRVKYSSTESMATSSSGGSLESIRSSTSEGNRSTSSSESHRSSSLSSHSSDSAGSTGYHNPVTSAPLGARFFHQTKLHILSPISDKSSQEPGSETSENNKNNNSQRASPEENTLASTTPMAEQTVWAAENPTVQLQKPKRRTPQNKNLINLGIGQSSGDSETHQGSDSGISIESRCGVGGTLNQNVTVDLNDLPFDMPKLRRRRLLQQPVASVQDTSGSATSVDLRDLPFDMPKLRRRLRGTPPSTESSGVSQASSSHSVQEVAPRPTSGVARPSLTLDLELSTGQPRPLGLSLDLGTSQPAPDIEVDLPLERQGWYHGAITRLEAENVLRHHDEGSYLVRNSESSRLDYSLSLKSARGFMHMRIQQCRESGKFILGQFSNPFTSIPEMIRHYTVNRLPIRGAEHMCLRLPVIEQLL
ncbi:uncharacterized protein LOC124366973 isoform X2 [Homalodisca vitripennis]|uniref:uncharacterized protein LOC124366973 isoform X2 n=1 Tax=Homalodisca vitripennis TaxID=197043 RepID=UPI001EEBE602|nr:uncharacterized protein LOC124366973 isoform X2 [Homalodisca vitripennis]